MHKKIFLIILLLPCLGAKAHIPVNCNTALGKSTAIINALLVELNENYTQVGGGGITGIKQSTSDSYVISIAQEERIDHFQYQVSIDRNCKVTIVQKNEMTKNPKL